MRRFVRDLSHGDSVGDVHQGAFQTPQILELSGEYGIMTSYACLQRLQSGIGNKQILDKFGVTTLLDLPGVGENLRECYQT